MIVKTQKPIEFKNLCGCIFDSDLLTKAIGWYSSKPVTRLKTVFLHGRYPGVAIYKDKIHVHRLIMCFVNRRKLARHEHVNHIDGNKLNATVSNLQVLNESAHISMTHKGRKLSPNHRWKIANAMCITRYGHPLHENPELLEAKEK